MDVRSHQTDFILIFVLFVCAMAAAVIAVGVGQDDILHQRTLARFRQLHVDQASLQRDVLQIRGGMLDNYDPLVRSVEHLHADLKDMVGLIKASRFDNEAEMGKLLEYLGKEIVAEDSAVEEFKTRSALLRNSYRIFSHVLSTNSSPISMDARAAPDSDALASLMMRYDEEPRPELAALLRLQFGSLMRSEFGRAHVLSRHGQLVLIMRPLVDAAINSIERSEISQVLQNLEQLYMQGYVQENRFADEGKLGLAAVALLLCGLVATLLRRLRTRSQALSTQLAFEPLRAHVKANLASCRAEEFHSALENALGSLFEFFDASGVALSINGMQAPNVQEFYYRGDVFGQKSDILLEESARKLAANTTVDPLSSDIVFVSNGNAAEHSVAVGCNLPDLTTSPITIFLVLHFRQMPTLADSARSLVFSALGIIREGIRLNRERTEKAALATRLEHAKRLEALGTLAGGVAHEFNNTLGAVLGYGELMLNAKVPRAKIVDYAKEIVGGCYRGLATTEKILSFSRKRQENLHPFDLNQAVVDNIVSLRVVLPIDFEVHSAICQEKLVVFGHPLEVHQIITNLCKNAADAAQCHGRCDVILEKTFVQSPRRLSHGELQVGEYALVTVVDNGPGISKNVLPRIFEPFFTTRGDSGGTGLGLAAVHGSMIALGGQLNLETAFGRGTRFDIYLPLTKALASPADVFFQDPVLSRGDGELVAIIDPDDDRRVEIEDYAAAFGYEPVGFKCSSELLKWLDKMQGPELVIVDHASCHSEEIDNIARRLENIPMIFLGSPEDVDMGDRVLLSRPISARQFAASLRACIERNRGLQSVREGLSGNS